MDLTVSRHVPIEWSYTASKRRDDPFNDVTLDVQITDERGGRWLVPAFWAGGNEYRVRFAGPAHGTYHAKSICSDTSDPGLHGRELTLHVEPYDGPNELLRRGPLRVSDNRRFLQHADGAPFFWLGDTWWMSLCKRITWPDEFQLMTADRVEQGFSVIQIIAGLYPDMPWHDERGANEAGFPWAEDFSRINPAWWDHADLRIAHLVRSGLLPCIVGCWAYFLPLMGEERAKQHWRTIIARWGAWPVVWCLAGEGAMPYYLSKDRHGDIDRQKAGWARVGRYVRDTDPYHRLITIHPTDASRTNIDDPSVLDFEMLQTGHNSHQSIDRTLRLITEAYPKTPTMPVLNSEVCYEGIQGMSGEEIQRYMFWSCVLRGACGHTYGANGIWQLDRPEKPFGPSPHGCAWGTRPWQEAYRLPGGRQVALGGRMLRRYEWWRMEPHPEWIDPVGSLEKPMDPICAGIPGELRIAYLPTAIGRWMPPHHIRQLEPGVKYRATYFNPRLGESQLLGVVEGDETGSWKLPFTPIIHDWVLVMERAL